MTSNHHIKSIICTVTITPIQYWDKERQRKGEQNSGLESQPKLPPLSLLTDLIQEPSDGLLLRQPGAVEMLADRQRELIFAHAVLADNPV